MPYLSYQSIALPVVSRSSEGTRLSNGRGISFFMSSSFGDQLMLQFDEGLRLQLLAVTWSICCSWHVTRMSWP